MCCRQQAKKKAAGAAENSLEILGNENEACQLQLNNKGFSFNASGKYKLDFDCDHIVAGNRTDALKAYQETVLQKLFADTEASLATDRSFTTA